MSTSKKLPDWHCAVLIAAPQSVTATTLPEGWLPNVQWEITPTEQARAWVNRLEEVSVHTDAGVCIFVAKPLPKWAAKIHTETLEWQRNWRKTPWPVRCITVSSLAEAAWYAQALARTDLLNTMSLDTRLAALQRRQHCSGDIRRHWWGYRTRSTPTNTVVSPEHAAHIMVQQRHIRFAGAVKTILQTQPNTTNTVLLTDTQGRLFPIDFLAYQEKRCTLPTGSHFEFCAGQAMVG